jgi:hypothetical protein
LLGVASPLSSPGSAAPEDIKTVEGACQAQSATAEGGAIDDLRQNKSPFSCDSAVITFFDKENRHILIQFAQKGSDQQRIVGYAGMMENDGQTLDVDHIYLEPGKPLTATDSACKLFFTQPRLTDIVCGGQIVEGARRTVATVIFKAAPGQ